MGAFCADILEHVDEACLARVERAVSPIGVGFAPSDVAGADLVEMTLRLWRRLGAHDQLDDNCSTWSHSSARIHTPLIISIVGLGRAPGRA